MVWSKQLVHDKFLHLARRSPDLVAITYGHQSYTYGQLANASFSIAQDLISAGVLFGDIVVIEGARDPLLVILIVATMRVGGTFLILEEGLPADYIRRVIGPIDSLHWLTSNRKLGEAEVSDLAGKKLRSYTEFPTGPIKTLAPTTAEPCASSPLSSHDNPLMYLALTSGSTGRPKLVQGPHGPVQHFLNWYSCRFRFNSEDRFSLLSGLGYDPMLRDIFTPLSVGGCICIPTVNDLQDKDGIIKWLLKSSVSVVHSTPALARITFHGKVGTTLSALRLIALGGGILDSALVGEIFRVACLAELANFYGATETPQVVTYYTTNIGEWARQTNIEIANRIVPLGNPIDDINVLLLDEQGQFCKYPEVGEICVSTLHLSEGYYLDPEATSRCFIPSPLETGGPGLYRTGDLGQFDEDGRLLFKGRLDAQIKCRGYRIQPELIEQVIREYSNIVHVAVVPEKRKSGDSRLICYLQILGRAGELLPEIRRHVLQRLPTYMLPESFVFLKSMPLTKNGKIDLNALANVEFPEPEYRVENHSNAIQQKIFEIWASILGLEIDTIGVNQNFFDIGGNSLLAARLVADLGLVFAQNIDITNIFMYPNVRMMAEFIANGKGILGVPEDLQYRSKKRLDQIAAVRAKRMELE